MAGLQLVSSPVDRSIAVAGPHLYFCDLRCRPGGPGREQLRQVFALSLARAFYAEPRRVAEAIPSIRSARRRRWKHPFDLP